MSEMFLRFFPTIAGATGLLALIFVYLRVQVLATTLEKRADTTGQQESDGLQSLTREIAVLADRVSTLEAEPRETAPAVTLRSGMNLNRRTQALRQHRLGRASSEIARNLEMPRAEVDLLIKVHRIVSQHVSL